MPECLSCSNFASVRRRSSDDSLPATYFPSWSNSAVSKISVSRLRSASLLEALIARIVADHAQLQVAVQQFVGQLARKTPPDLHLDLRVHLAVTLDVLQQI